MDEKQKQKLIEQHERYTKMKGILLFVIISLSFSIGMPVIYAWLQSIAPDWANQGWIGNGMDGSQSGYITSPLGLSCFLFWVLNVLILVASVGAFNELGGKGEEDND